MAVPPLEEPLHAMTPTTSSRRLLAVASSRFLTTDLNWTKQNYRRLSGPDNGGCASEARFGRLVRQYLTRPQPTSLTESGKP